MMSREEKALFPLNETENLWEMLAHANREIVLFGMGNGAEKLLLKAQEFGIVIQDIFASDEFVRGQVFRGFKVKTFREIVNNYDDPIILVAFGTEDPEVLERINKIGENYTVFAPDIPLFGKDDFNENELDRRKERLEKLYVMLADDMSRTVLKNLLNYRLSGKIKYLKAIESTRENTFNELFRFNDSEIYVDLGAYDGDTIEEFLSLTYGKYKTLVAFEPDKKNFVKLQHRMEILDLKAELYPYASWNEKKELSFSGKAGRSSALGTKGYMVEANSVDNILNGRGATFIKMDVEGAEKETLLGLKNTIQMSAPKLLVSAYHRTWDFLELSELIFELNPTYKIYLRHHPYIPAWETNIYAISEK